MFHVKQGIVVVSYWDTTDCGYPMKMPASRFMRAGEVQGGNACKTYGAGRATNAVALL